MARRTYHALEPDEIFIDSENLPAFNKNQMEGRIERPLSPGAFRGLIIWGALLILICIGQVVYLDIFRHDYFAAWSEQNHLRQGSIVAVRGVIEDRNGLPLAENTTSTSTATSTVQLARRTYPLGDATAQLVGYVSYPKRDQNGYWYQLQTEGVSGAEQLFDADLRGQNGIQIEETNASGEAVSGEVVESPVAGKNIQLSIDSELQKAMYGYIKERVDASFVGGAGAIMDVQSGELLSLVSYPSFDPEVMSSGEPKAQVQKYISDKRSPFLDRAVTGLYAPGSIVKPFVAVAALTEGIVSPEKSFFTTGQLVLPNPYDPKKPSIFKDWRNNGVVDMRRAIAVSSDVYFYIVGGGFEDQRGLGISAIDAYAAKFGFGQNTGFPDDGEPSGTVPSPTWKAEHFDESVWRVGDTYNTSIGQYGWQVTLLQAVRGVASLANGGTLVTPTIVKDEVGPKRSVGIPDKNLEVARQGMRMGVTDGIVQQLAFPEVQVAAKTGTAEVGTQKELANSLIVGFFPYAHPRYAFAIILEHSKAGTLVGAQSVMHNVLAWVIANKPEMVQSTVTFDSQR